MASDGLGEMFEGDFADTYGENVLLMSIGGQADLSSMHIQGARTPIGASGNFSISVLNCILFCSHCLIFA